MPHISFIFHLIRHDYTCFRYIFPKFINGRFKRDQLSVADCSAADNKGIYRCESHNKTV